MSAKVKLEHPVEHQGTTYTEITMRRPKVRDQKAAARAGKTPEEQETAMLVNLCEVAPEVFEEMDLADYLAVQKAYKGFFPEGTFPA